MAAALQGLSSLGAALHVGGSLLIVVGQTVVKIAHCIKETSGLPHSWTVPWHVNPKPQWCGGLLGGRTRAPLWLGRSAVCRVLQAAINGNSSGQTGYHRHAKYSPTFHLHGRRRPDGRWHRLWSGSKAVALLGWTLFAAGNLARFVSMRFASQTVLSGLGSLQFVLIPLVSHALLGIRPDGATAVGVVVVVIGTLARVPEWR